MDRPLSDAEIKRALKGKVTVLPYVDLAKFKSLQQLLSPYGRVAILYPNKDNGDGHWVALLCYIRKGKEIIEIFDPYGRMPDLGDMIVDEELSFIDRHKRIGMGIHRAYLSDLIMKYIHEYQGPKSDIEIEYNEKPMQEWGDDINTCGRHVISRLLNNNMDLQQYQKEFKGIKNPDMFVTEYTNRLFPFLRIFPRR